MFTAEELRQAKVFACVDEAECARLAQTIADVRLGPGEWLFREGAPASFYVVLEGRLRIVLDVHGKQTEFAEHVLVLPTVQSAMIGGIDPETAAKGFEDIISSQLTPRR